MEPVEHRKYVETNGSRIVLPLSLLEAAILGSHYKMSHFGHNRTIEMLKRNWWRPKFLNIPNLETMAKEYVNACAFCQRKKNTRNHDVPILPNKIPTMPGQIVAVDFFGPLGPSKEEEIVNNIPRYTGRVYTYMLVCIDLFSNYVCLYPCESQTGYYAVKGLTNLIAHHGCPEIVKSDNAQQFHSKVFEGFLRILGIKHTCILAYNPQGNGQVERANRVVKAVLQTCDKGDKNWHEMIPYVQMSLNSAHNRTLADNSAFVHFGRDLRLPFDLAMSDTVLLNAGLLASRSPERFAVQLQSRILAVQFNALSEIEENRKKDHEYRNKGRVERKIEPGDRVMVELELQKSDCGKFQSSLYGPFRVLLVDNHQVTVKTLAGSGIYQTHMDKCKRINPEFKQKLQMWKEKMEANKDFIHIELTEKNRKELLKKIKEMNLDSDKSNEENEENVEDGEQNKNEPNLDLDKSDEENVEGEEQTPEIQIPIASNESDVGECIMEKQLTQNQVEVNIEKKTTAKDKAQNIDADQEPMSAQEIKDRLKVPNTLTKREKENLERELRRVKRGSANNSSN